jgi:uncharacterized BrkB/YihY/UPF0761 family membrane protein
MVEIEKAIPIVSGRWSALSYAVLFVVFGFAVRRVTSTGSSLLGVFAAAIAFVTLGYWIGGYLTGTPRGWLGAPVTIAIAALYFFTLMAIGVGAASLRLRRWNR